MGATGETVRSIGKSWKSSHYFTACSLLQGLIGYDQDINAVALLQVDFTACHFTNPSHWTSKSPTLLGAQGISLLTSVVNYSRTTNSQFGPRWYKSYPGHNEEDFQHEQQEVHDRSPVLAVDWATNGLD
jgi:hypothetical protein